MAEKIDDLDKRILKSMFLGEGVGAKMTELANELAVSRSTINLRVGKLQSKGIITGYKPEIDWEKLGFDLITYIGLVCPDEAINDLIKILKEEDSIYEIREITTGTFDLLIKCRFKGYADMKRLHKLIMDVEGVRDADIWLLGPDHTEK